ncbi:hypothetical protein H632_c756p0 [Helicosporidium sp. ATCC 50920]|nr:hypothetical protein H632_c756p0 [Helicosporidium sp. ATCC 50920]|eukprot:KDD75302.1 hypothetical protein H632_c756p0 [Helicosporidium sp. ATCC 50920]
MAPTQPGVASLRTPPRRLFISALVACHGVWVVCLLAGMWQYDDDAKPPPSTSLPLHRFDRLVRRYGGLFALSALMARTILATLFRPSFLPKRSGALTVPAILYVLHSLVREAVYRLHMAGLIFSGPRWHGAGKDQTNAEGTGPHHVMSDHILLGACQIAGLASEVALALLERYIALSKAQEREQERRAGRESTSARGKAAKLEIREKDTTQQQDSFSSSLVARRASAPPTALARRAPMLAVYVDGHLVYACAAAVLTVLVAAECYFTARYFHPRVETVVAAVMGGTLFQAPTLFFNLRLLSMAGKAPAAPLKAPPRSSGTLLAVPGTSAHRSRKR